MKSVGVCSSKSRFSFPPNLFHSYIMSRYNSSDRNSREEWRRELERGEEYRNYGPSPSLETVSEWHENAPGGSNRSRSRREGSEASDSTTCCAAYRSAVLSDLMDTGI